MQKTIRIYTFLACLIVFSGCIPAAPIPTQTPTVQPTPTLIPTSTPTPKPTLPPCLVEIFKFQDDIKTPMQDWVDAEKIAESANRLTIGTIILAQQKIVRTIENLTVGACAKPLQAQLIAAYTKGIEFYTAFMGGKDILDLRLIYNDYDLKMTVFTRSLLEATLDATK